MSTLNVQVYHSIHEIEPAVWDQIVARRGFQSHGWYAFGERAMAEAQPTYLLAFDGETPVAGAALFKVHNEPLPLPSVARKFMESIFKEKPLLVCRSPLADTSALLLPGGALHDPALVALASAAQEQFKKQKCSFLVFDYLLTEQLKYAWTPGYEPITISEPGTFMPMEWESLEGYLESRNPKDREELKKSIQDVEQNGFVLSKHASVSELETALTLISNASIWQGSAPSPWARGLLENFPLADGTWLELRKEGKLAGCVAILRDNNFQLVTALGLEDDVPGGYLYLLYAALKEAFEHKVRLVRFGAGSYDIKHKLGFHLEDTNHAMIAMAGFSTRGKKK